MYIILPDSDVSTTQAIMIILLFFLFCVYLTYLASYRSGFTPNYLMLFRYLVGYNDEQNFTTFIRNLSLQEKKNPTEGKVMGKKENFISHQQGNAGNVPSEAEVKVEADTEADASDYLTSYFERIASFFIISDNKVRIRL